MVFLITFSLLFLVQKKRAGKKKIPIEYIFDAETRKSCFRKRIYGIMKKIWELHILTGTILDFSCYFPDMVKSYILNTNTGLDLKTLPPQMKTIVIHTLKQQGDNQNLADDHNVEGLQPEELRFNKDSPPPLVSSPSMSSIDGEHHNSGSLDGCEKTFSLDDGFLEEIFSSPESTIDNTESGQSWMELVDFDECPPPPTYIPQQEYEFGMDGGEQTLSVDNMFLEELLLIPDSTIGNMEFIQSWMEQQPPVEFDINDMNLEAP
ncbi:type I MADS-domain transcription factor [Selaginella moellendorffii]|uniref:Type I MADS-domain transcription factor n=1 Tax=Selaginella moellendorffii TaxID=88036 RepID=D8RPU3_SELML|nr:type I MADS-domain transcription factor [Selaginella moellendorffii]